MLGPRKYLQIRVLSHGAAVCCLLVAANLNSPTVGVAIGFVSSPAHFLNPRRLALAALHRLSQRRRIPAPSDHRGQRLYSPVQGCGCGLMLRIDIFWRPVIGLIVRCWHPLGVYQPTFRNLSSQRLCVTAQPNTRWQPFDHL